MRLLTLPLLLISLTLTTTALLSHERLTIGPNGGRFLAIDSVATPRAEVILTPEHRFQITFFDADRKPLPLADRKLTVTAGDRSNAKKLATEPKADALLTEPAPEGSDYYLILQLREPGAAKSIPIRMHYNAAVCGECHQPEWLCTCGMEHSGKNIEVPATLEALWAEINQHTHELHENTTDKAYEAMDEVTEAFPILLTALPAKTEAAQQPAATKLVEELKASLTAIRTTFAIRKPAEAQPHLETFDKNLTTLKALYPASIANAKLKE